MDILLLDFMEVTHILDIVKVVRVVVGRLENGIMQHLFIKAQLIAMT